MPSRDELLHLIALNRIYTNRTAAAKKMIQQFGSAELALKQLPAEQVAEQWRFANAEMDWIEQHHLTIVPYNDTRYPHRLATCADAPLLLFTKGNANLDGKYMVAVVGTRQATERGKDMTRNFVLNLAEKLQDVTIISGLAYGIDIAAHRAAIEAKVPTIIVPAHGLDRIYPTLHRNDAIRALEYGGIVTEYASHTEPEKLNFVFRNRIIAGLADCTVVVESRTRGGALITASMANAYNRPVFAFPGRPNDMASEGCNNLIRNHNATLIHSADDVIQDMQWHTHINIPTQTELIELDDTLTDEQRNILQQLRQSENGLMINELLDIFPKSYGQLIETLMNMELNGLIRSMPGGNYRAMK